MKCFVDSTFLLLKHILTPIIYKVEYDDYVEFLCFCDKGILMKEDYVEGIIAKLKECEDICLLDLILQLLVKVGADNV